MTAVHGWYPVDDKRRALRWRLKHLQRALDDVRRGGNGVPDPLALLTIVVDPKEDFKAVSLQAVCGDREATAP